MGIVKDRLLRKHQQFLLTFFDDKLCYQEKEVNGFMLTKNIDGDTGKPIIYMYTKESWNGSRQFLRS